MTIEQIDSIRLAGEFISPDLTISSVCEIEGVLCINDLVPLSVADCSKSLQRTLDIPIEDKTGRRIGSLCICKDRTIDPSAFTLDQYVAFLVDSQTTSPPSDYQFLHNYVVIKKEYVLMYLSTMQHSAPVWGGFVHTSRHTAIPPLVVSEECLIVASDNICLPTPVHERLAMRSVSSATPSERYLQLYHQLELLFDWVVVQDIKNLSDDLLGAGKILSGYASADLPRLNNLLTRYLLSPDSVVTKLGALRTYENEGKKIFQDYGKDGNPLKEAWTKWMNCLQDGEPTETKVKQFKIPTDSSGYRGFIIRVTAYFIYRIRCCVAHSKIGEYVLRDTDEEFVVQFGEPLLRAVLVELLSHPKILVYSDNRLVPDLWPVS